MKLCLTLLFAAAIWTASVVPASASAKPCCQTAYEEREVVCYRMICETHWRDVKVNCFRPVYETAHVTRMCLIPHMTVEMVDRRCAHVVMRPSCKVVDHGDCCGPRRTCCLVPEVVSRVVRVPICRVTYDKVKRTVPVTRCKMVRYQQTRRIPYVVTKKVPYTRIVRVPVCEK